MQLQIFTCLWSGYTSPGEESDHYIHHHKVDALSTIVTRNQL